MESLGKPLSKYVFFGGKDFGEVSGRLKAIEGHRNSLLVNCNLAVSTKHSSDFYTGLHVPPKSFGHYILEYLEGPYSKFLMAGSRIECAGAH